tara:strand:+ start:93 stop:860 length:768 start_codon:yes stop_codon:yes gene_type:complete
MKIFTELRTKVLEFRLFFFKSNQELTIVTGSDSSHFKSLFQLLESLSHHEKETKIIVFDLGLSKEESEKTTNNFPNIELRKFDYSKYPSYFNIKINAGEYAWKPVIINTILNEFKSSVCWIDAGNKVFKPLINLRKIIELYGFYSPYSKGKIIDWTHFKTLKFLNVDDNHNILKKTNLNGSCICVNYNNDKVKKFIDEWKDYALVKDCIAPEGSNRENHRQDQAVLSTLAYLRIPDITKKMTFKKFGFKTHQDVD